MAKALGNEVTRVYGIGPPNPNTNHTPRRYLHCRVTVWDVGVFVYFEVQAQATL